MINDLYATRRSKCGQAKLIEPYRVGWDFHIGFMPYSERWRGSRRAFHQHFRPNAIADYAPKTRKWVCELVRHLLATPEDFIEHIN